MKKLHLLSACLFFLVQLANSQGITVAGGNGGGPAPNQFAPAGIFIHGTGNIYIADLYNNRIQKWVPGAVAGVTVAGGNGGGSAPNQLSSPLDVFVDATGNMYIADFSNHRIQKWAPGASAGITVAGGNGLGSGANQLAGPRSVFVDAAGNIYIAEYINHRIQKWAPGALAGITVGGGNGDGSSANQLSGPSGVFVDASGNIFIADMNNSRVQKWAPGASSGVNVAGRFNAGATASQLANPTDVFVDTTGNIFISDAGNHRIQKWAPGASTGITVAGGNGPGNSAYQLNSPNSVFVEASGSIYVGDAANQRVQEFQFPVMLTSSANGLTVAGGNGYGSGANQLAHPSGIFVDATGNMYISDAENHRIQKWAPGASAGVTVAGGNGQGGAANQFVYPNGVFVDAGGNMYIADANNHRIQKWVPGALAGTTVAGGDEGSAPNQLSFPYGVFVDSNGNLYVADGFNHRIQKWSPGASAGITVAGGNGAGPAANQFNFPDGVFVDAIGNLYVSDGGNHRVQKWSPGAVEGVTVAGGNRSGPAPYQLSSPAGIFVDASGNIYVADYGNHRIQKWTPGALSGVTVAGTNIQGLAAIHLSNPAGVFVDASGNIYVADYGKDRIQKYGSGSGLAYKYFEGNWNNLPDFNALTPVKTGNTPNINLNLRTSGRNDNFAFIWEGKINIPNAGTYTFETISDDGSNVYFNTPYSAGAIPTVNNDGIHHAKSATGTVNVSAPGAYPIAITFFEKDGGEQMQLYWTGPGITRQLIPDGAFTFGSGEDRIPPGIPTNLREASKGGNYIDLDWDDVTDNSGVIVYDVYIGNERLYTTGESQITADNLSPNTSYTFGVKARDLAGNISEFSNRFTGTTSGTINGLIYKYYEGNWNTVPDFTMLVPVKTGHSPNVDIGVRTTGKNDQFAFLWQGYINITTPGRYTFETVSDDGSKLYFNSLYSPSAIPIVNNDGLHAPNSATGSVEITTAGFYPISITFFEKDGGEHMQVYWTGPGFSRQLIPDNAFMQTPPVTLNGLKYKYYEGDFFTLRLPSFEMLTPVKTGSSANIDLSVRTPGRNDNFALLWEGYINISTPGIYTFETVSDDGSKLYFNSFYTPFVIETVSNDGVHAPRSAKGTVNITSAGSYPIAISFFEREVGELMEVYWTGPGITRQLIPNEAFTQTARQPSSSPEITSIQILKSLADGIDNTKQALRIYPNPFNQSFNVDFYNSSWANDINIGIYDMKGRLIYAYRTGNLPPGKTIMKMNLDERLLPWGMYMAEIRINGIQSKIIKLIKTKK